MLSLARKRQQRSAKLLASETDLDVILDALDQSVRVDQHGLQSRGDGTGWSLAGRQMFIHVWKSNTLSIGARHGELFRARASRVDQNAT